MVVFVMRMMMMTREAMAMIVAFFIFFVIMNNLWPVLESVCTTLSA